MKKKINILLETPSKYYFDNISEFLSNSQYPNWTKDIPKLTITEHFNNAVNTLFRIGNIKQCPAFVDIIKNSLTLYCPADITIEIKKDTKEWRFFSPWGKVKITQHDLLNQMGPSNPISKNGIHLKFETPFLIKTNKPAKFYFMQPMYHEILDYQVIPGAISTNSKYPLQLNLNVFISNKFIEFDVGETALIRLKKGSPLAYMHFGDDLVVENIKCDLINVNEEFYPERLCEISNYEKLSKI